MMIKRWASYLGMAIAMCLGSFTAHAAERIEYVVAASYSDGWHGVESVKHELTMMQWRQGSDTGASHIKSNLIALSNHFGLVGAVPMATPDWPAAVNV